MVLGLKVARLSRNLTQRELADRIGVDRAYLSKVESGRVRCGNGFKRRAANALGIPPEFLFEPVELPHVDAS